jgi:hypothetical protein
MLICGSEDLYLTFANARKLRWTLRMDLLQPTIRVSFIEISSQIMSCGLKLNESGRSRILAWLDELTGTRALSYLPIIASLAVNCLPHQKPIVHQMQLTFATAAGRPSRTGQSHT